MDKALTGAEVLELFRKLRPEDQKKMLIWLRELTAKRDAEREAQTK